MFWRSALNEIRAGYVYGLFHEVAKLHATGTGALDADLNNFISTFIRLQLQRFYEQLYKNRRWHLINGQVSEEFSEHTVACGTGVLIRDK